MDDLSYNDFDDQDHDEEEEVETHVEEGQGEDPMHQLVKIYRQKMDHQPPPPRVPDTTRANAFKAFKSLKPPEFKRIADPFDARAWLKKMEKTFEIMGTEGA